MFISERSGNKQCLSYVLAADGLNHIVRRRSKQFCDDGKLIDVILAGEQGLSLEHLRENAASAPDVNLNVVLLPREHDFGGSVVSRRHISSHLRVLDAGKSEVANLQIAVLVDQDVAGLEIAVNDASRVDIFQTTLKRVRRAS